MVFCSEVGTPGHLPFQGGAGAAPPPREGGRGVLGACWGAWAWAARPAAYSAFWVALLKLEGGVEAPCASTVMSEENSFISGSGTTSVRWVS